MQTFFRYVRK